MRIEDALDRFIIQLRADGRSDHTIRQYARHVRSLQRWLNEQDRPDDIAAIDYEVIAAFLVSPEAGCRPDGRPKKATSANSMRSSLRNFFGYLHRAGLVTNDPARLVRRARCGPPPPRALTTKERSRLLATLDEAATPGELRDRALFRLMLATGVRIGAAVTLNVEDVDLDAAELWITTKGDRRERVCVPRDEIAHLREYIDGRAASPLFAGRGGAITSRHAQRRFAQWLRRAGIERSASPHSLRHSFATRLLARTGDLRLVQDALGHRSIASTTIYARVDEGRLRAAING